MVSWLENPHADYVLAAYAVAFVGLVGCALWSWSTMRRHARHLERIKQQPNGLSQ